MTNEIIMASHWKGKSTDSTQSPIPTALDLNTYRDTGFNAVVFAEITYNGQKQNFIDIFAGANGWSQTSNPIKTTIDNIHARGMKAYFNMNPNRYGGKSGFLNRTADYTQFMRDLEYVVGLGVDGINVEEGFFTTAAGGTYAKVNQFSRDMRAKVPRPIILTATPSFNTETQCVANNWDHVTMNSEDIYDYISPQPGKGPAPDYLIENSRIQSSYNFWSGVHPNAKTMPCLYKLYGTATGSVINVNMISNVTYVFDKGWGIFLWPTEYLSAADNTALKATFPATTPNTGFIDVKTTPTGASVEYDGVLQTGVTDIILSGIVPSVVHTVILRKNGYKDITETVLVSPGLTAYIDKTLESSCVPNWQCEAGNTGFEIDGCGGKQANSRCDPLPTKGSLDLKSIPQGAEVYLDNINQGLTDVILVDILAGVHEVKLLKAGYEDVTDIVTIIAGESLPKTYTLVSTAPNTGTLNFVSNPAGAIITANNQVLGTAPISVELTPGHYAVIASLGTYPNIADEFDIAAGETITKIYTFEDKKKVVLLI